MPYQMASQRSDLRWWQRLRILYCSCEPECNLAWFSLIVSVGYMLIAISCISLVFRMVLHMMIVMQTLFFFFSATVLVKLRKQLQSDYPDVTATVVKVKKIPQVQVHKSFPQKNFCWLQYTDEELNTHSQSNLPSEDELTEDNKISKPDSAETKQSQEELLEELNKWSSIPCAIINGANVGDTVTVKLIEGKPTTPIHVPSQHKTIKDYVYSCLSKIVWIVSAFVLLYLFYDVPVLFANSGELQDSINDFSGKFWQLFDNGKDDKMGDDDSADDDLCRIPWYVGLSYDGMILMMCLFPLGFAVKILTALKQAEKPTEGAYKLLSENEDDGEQDIPTQRNVV